MKNSEWIAALIIAALILSVADMGNTQLFRSVLGRGFSGIGMFREPPPWDTFSLYLVIVKTVISSVNTVLLTIVLVIYVEVYYKTESKFSLGLVIFTIALLLYALTSNPIIHGFAGFRGSGLGPFTILPDLFTCIASAILLYLSRQ